MSYRDEKTVPSQLKAAFLKAFEAAVGNTCTSPVISVYENALGWGLIARDSMRPRARVEMPLDETPRAADVKAIAVELAHAVDREDRVVFGMRTIIEDPNPPVSVTHGHAYRYGNSKLHKGYVFMRSNGMTKGLTPEQCRMYEGIKDKAALGQPLDPTPEQAEEAERQKERQAAADAALESLRLVKEAKAEEARLAHIAAVEKAEQERLAREEAERRKVREAERAKEKAAKERAAFYEANEADFGLF